MRSRVTERPASAEPLRRTLTHWTMTRPCSRLVQATRVSPVAEPSA